MYFFLYEDIQTSGCYCLNCHSLTCISSLHEAKSPGIWGFQDTELTSWSWALGTVTNNSKLGAFGSLLGSIRNMRMESSPQAVAISPVWWHQATSYIARICTPERVQTHFQVGSLSVVAMFNSLPGRYSLQILRVRSSEQVINCLPVASNARLQTVESWAFSELKQIQSSSSSRNIFTVLS